jgi:uncharacterized protein YegL
MPSNISKPNKIGLTGFAARAKLHEKTAVEDGVIMADNRIVLLLDNSGSMNEVDGGAKPKIELLKDAVQGFINACDFSNTAVGMYAIPVDSSTVKLTDQGALVMLAVLGFTAPGGTPMGESMRQALEHEPMTRAVLISDGEATDNPFNAAENYKRAEVPIDCIHIGSGKGGEETLVKIAEMTGGKFLKFTDVAKFATALKYLSPKYRALLADPSVAKAIGADRIR